MSDFITVDKMLDIRKSAGQSDKKIQNSATEFISTPESGVFTFVGTKEFDIPGIGKVISVGLHLEGGGFVSENALNQQHLLDEMTEIKTGARKGKFMLKSERLTDLSKFGPSADARLVGLQGKAFSTTKRIDTRVYKAEYLDAKKFDEVCAANNSATALKDALKKTETKVGYVFSVNT